MAKKLLAEVTEKDLMNIPVWEYFFENDVEYVEPADTLELFEKDNKAYIVLTEFTTSKGNLLRGYSSPQDASGLDYIQPVVFTQYGQLALWYEEAKIDLEAQKLIEEDLKDLFPIEYKALVRSDQVYYHGVVENFNQRFKLSR